MRALFFSASIFFLVGAIGNVRGDCKDIATSGVGVDVGWKSQPTCKKIRNQYPKLCENKNTVKYNCAKSCGTCGFNPQTDCVDTKGKFTVGSRQRRCNYATKKPKMCNRTEFQFNCPNLCDACGGGGGGSNMSVTLSPTAPPTTTPTFSPSPPPSRFPTATPTFSPSRAPTDAPTALPTPTQIDTGSKCTGKAPDCCNGLTNTCSLRVNEMMFAAMHNANNDENKWNSNHQAPLEKALEKGFRAFYLDVCFCLGKVVFCHGNCFWAGQQNPTEIFENVVQFLDNNPSEIVIFNFEISQNNLSPQQLWNVMKQVDGLQTKSYVHSGGAWPEVGTLLKNGKQIISLKHNGDGCLDTSSPGCTPYIQEFFKYTLGTKYDFNSISEIENIQNSCVGFRGTFYEKRFYAINSFVTNDFPGPSKTSAETLNQENFVKKRISDCEGLMKRDANFYAVDFWQQGAVTKVVQDINAARGEAKLSKSRGQSSASIFSTSQILTATIVSVAFYFNY